MFRWARFPAPHAADLKHFAKEGRSTRLISPSCDEHNLTLPLPWHTQTHARPGSFNPNPSTRAPYYDMENWQGKGVQEPKWFPMTKHPQTNISSIHKLFQKSPHNPNLASSRLAHPNKTINYASSRPASCIQCPWTLSFVWNNSP